MLTAQKDVILYKADEETGIVAIVDETPIVLEPIMNLTLDKIGTVDVKIRTFGKSKQRVSCILCIFDNDKKAPFMLVFKGKPYSNLESKFNKHPYVSRWKIFIARQNNAWVDTNTFKIWLDKIWFRSYNFSSIADIILNMDSATSHVTDDILNKFEKYHAQYRLVPPDLTSYCQSLEICINKPFKDLLKKYRQFLIIIIIL